MKDEYFWEGIRLGGSATHTFLAPRPTRHKLIFLSNFAISVASILFAKLSLTTTVYRRFGVVRYDHQPNVPTGSYALHLFFFISITEIKRIYCIYDLLP
jgi:hypothetical protein